MALFALPNLLAQTTSVVGWGFNNNGQASPPSGLTNIVAVAAGGGQSAALRANGTVVNWGFPLQPGMPPGLTDIKSIACGRGHTLALSSNGTLHAWGENESGQTQIPINLSNVVTMSGGTVHTLAVDDAGTVKAWGDNKFGQLNVPKGLSNVIAVAAGGNSFTAFSVALKSDGTVVAWGDNRTLQTNVPPGLSNVVAIAASPLLHSLALKSDGTVVAWGIGLSATNIPRGLSNVVAIAAGSGYSLALRANGIVTAWGENSNGETIVPTTARNVIAISAGWFHNVALTRTTAPSWPHLVAQPQSTRALLGDSLTMTVSATSTTPLIYRWQHHGQDIPGATTATLLLTNLQPHQAGDYAVIVSADGLSVRSAPAFLSLRERPMALAQSVEGAEDTDLMLSLPGVDADNLPLSRTLLTLPQRGQLFEVSEAGPLVLIDHVPTTLGTDRVRYVPSPDVNGVDEFSFAVANELGASLPARIRIQLQPVNDPPQALAVASSPGALSGNNSPVVLVVAANHSNAVVVLDGHFSTDIDDQELSYSWWAEGSVAPVAVGIRVTNVFALGHYVIELRVADKSDVAIAPITLDVISPGEAVELLIEQLNNAALDRREKRPLVASLKAVVASFERLNGDASVHQLDAFANKIRSQVARTNPVLAQHLATAAEQIAALIQSE